MNAMIVVNHHIFLIVRDRGMLVLNIIDEEAFLLRINISLIRSGRDAVIVYIIRYMPAWIRSGWYPHPIIMISVGMRDSSNMM